MKKLLITISSLVAASGIASAAYYKGDINRDGKVDLADMAVLATAINSGTTDKNVHDVNGSGAVDDADLDALADIILSEKLTADTGLNIGIGGWGDGGEWGGVVSSPGIPRRASSATEFFLDGPKYDFTVNSTYVEFGIESTPSPVSGILFNIRLPRGVTVNPRDFVELSLPGTAHRLYGKPVVKKDYDEYDTDYFIGNRIRFILFSDKFEALPDVRTTLGRIYYSVEDDVYGEAFFKDCQTITGDDKQAIVVPSHYSVDFEWDYNPGAGLLPEVDILDESLVDIYNVNGVIVGKSLPADAVSDLAPGIYVIRQGDNVYKIKR